MTAVGDYRFIFRWPQNEDNGRKANAVSCCPSRCEMWVSEHAVDHPHDRADDVTKQFVSKHLGSRHVAGQCRNKNCTDNHPGQQTQWNGGNH